MFVVVRWLALLLLLPFAGAYGPLGDVDGDGVGDFTDGEAVLLARSGVTGDLLWEIGGQLTIDANMDGTLDVLRFMHHDVYVHSGKDLRQIAGPLQARSQFDGSAPSTIILAEDQKWIWFAESAWLIPGYIVHITEEISSSSEDSIGTQLFFVGNKTTRDTQEVRVKSLLDDSTWTWTAPEATHVASRITTGPDLSGDGTPDLLVSLQVEDYGRSHRSILWLDSATGAKTLLWQDAGDDLLEIEWVGDAAGWLLVADDKWRSIDVSGELIATTEPVGDVLSTLATSAGAVLQTANRLVDRQLTATPYHHEWSDLFAGSAGDVYLEWNDDLQLHAAESGRLLWSQPMPELLSAQGFDDGLIVTAQNLGKVRVSALHLDGTTSWTQDLFGGGGRITFQRAPDMTGDGVPDLIVDLEPKCVCSKQSAILDAADGTILISTTAEKRLSPVVEVHARAANPLVAWAPLALLGLIRRFYQP